MTDKQLVEFSYPFSWDFGATRRRGLIVGLRSGLYALAFLLLGAFMLVLGTLSGSVFLADRECSAYGCGDSLAEMFVMGLGCGLAILITAVAMSFFYYRDWNSVD